MGATEASRDAIIAMDESASYRAAADAIGFVIKKPGRRIRKSALAPVDTHTGDEAMTDVMKRLHASWQSPTHEIDEACLVIANMIPASRRWN